MVDSISEINNALDIAHLSGVSWNELLGMIQFPNYYYNVFSIKKKSGGYREISSPRESLDKVQIFIKNKILDLIPIHKSAVGYVKKMSILDNAKFHQKSEVVLSLDIKNFYPSINKERLYYIFLNICGYKKEVADTLVRLVSRKNGLPQGARTSPSLSNIVAFQLDKVLYNFCNKKNIKYTRYVDDLTFSGSQQSINKDFYFMVKWLINKQGFQINNKKSYYSKIVNGAIITGLRVYNNKIMVPRSFVKKVKSELYYLEKYGVESVKEKNQISNRNYLGHLEGKIKYINFIEPNIGEDLLRRMEEIMIRNFETEFSNGTDNLYDLIRNE